LFPAAAAAEASPPPDHGHYVGSVACKRCHEEIYAFWKLGTFALKRSNQRKRRFASSTKQKSLGGLNMLRSILLAATAVATMSATAAIADNKSDCQKGVAMIKAELKKKHPAPVLVTLRKTLSDAQTEVIEEDWSECMDHIKTARAALGK
jgi:hypothetical protein